MTQRVVNYTYGTGNPVLPDGSIDVRDGIDNLQSFDIFMNADEDAYNQRDGGIVKTLSGAIRSIGIQRVGDFTAGCTVTDRNQGVLYETNGTVYVWLGSLPKVVPPASSPSSTGGVSPSGDWLDVGDASLRSDLASESGADLVSFKQSGSGSVIRTLQDKAMNDYPTVLDYGATGAGDDTAAFSAAQASHDFIEVPAGMSFNVSSGLNYWQFFGRGTVSEPGKQWTLTPYPQVNALGKHYVERTFGIYEQAVGQSITINSGQGQTKENTQVLGTDTKGLAQDYTDRDHVAQYISSYSYTPDVLDATTTYTATTLTNAAVGALHAAGKIKPGMVIDTLHATICTGRVQSVSGNTITVDVWWPRVGAAPVTPSNGTGSIINPNNKIFGQNIVVRSSGNGTTTGSIKFSGVELDLFTPPSSSPVSGTWGYDMAVLGGYLDVGYQIRGKRNISFFSNNAGGGGLFGFRSVGDSRAVSIEDATSKAIEVVTGGSQRFAVDSDGTTHIVGGAVHFIGELQTTGTFTSIGLPWAVGHGALFYITGFNPGTGQEGKFLIAANNTGAGSVYFSDGSGATVSFQVSGGMLQIMSTTGVYQFTAFQLLI